jgi:hypothetical protein
MTGEGFLIAGARLTASAFAAIYRRLRRPKLVVYARAEDPFVKHTTTPLPDHVSAMDAITRNMLDYYRVQVLNGGKEQARACRLQIIGIRYVEHGVWRDYDGWEPVTLKWSNVKTTVVDISPREDAYCDIGHFASNYIQNNLYRHDFPRRRLGQTDHDHHAWFYLECHPVPNHQPGALGHGDYCFRMRLVSSNVATLEFGIYFKSMGQFSSLATGVPEGTIFEAPSPCPEAQTVFHERGSGVPI